MTYFKSKLDYDAHSSIKNENAQVNHFNGPVFCSYNASNSCGVLIAYLGKKSFLFNKQKRDKAGKTLILDVTLDQHILKKLYNANAETEQVKTLEQLQSLLKIVDINQNKRIIFACGFNIFFNSKLEAKGGKPLLKRKSIARLVEIKGSLDISHIQRIRNLKSQGFTFRQNHSTGFIERRLDQIFSCNCLQEFVNNTRHITCSINCSFSSIDPTFKS